MGIMVYFFSALLIILTAGEKCDDIRCSNILDEVCAIAETKNRTSIKLKFHNICFMRKAACEEGSYVEVNQVENEICNFTTRRNKAKSDDYQDVDTRRVTDFGIVGSYQACDHSCPIACTDAYEPACAKIWKKNMQTYTLKTMLNHCHVDLFSCTTGLNVTINYLSGCLSNAMMLQLPFIKSAAAMKSLGLISDDANDYGQNKRRSNVAVAPPDEDEETSLKNHLKDVVRRLFVKYRNVN